MFTLKQTMLRYGPWSLLLMAVATLALSQYVPLYIDDIMFPIVSARGGYDGWHNIGVYPLCANNYDTVIPALLLPGRVLAWLLYVPLETPALLRVWSIGLFAGWMMFLCGMYRRSFARVPARICVLGMLVGMNFLGVLPFMAALLRPEAMLAGAVSFYALLPFYLREQKKAKRAALMLLHLLLSSWFFGTHPKTFFFAPLALYAMWRVRKPGAAGWAGMAALVGIVAQAFQFAVLRTQCADDASFSRYFDVIVLQPRLFADAPWNFVARFFSGIVGSWHYIEMMLFAPIYSSRWLPATPMGYAQVATNGLIMLVAVGIAGFWVVSLCVALRDTWKKKTFFAPGLVVPLLMLGGMVFITAFKQFKGFYDVPLIWFSGSCLTLIFLQQRSKRFGECAFFAVGMIAFLSQCVLLYTFWDLPQRNREADSNGVLAEQPKSGSILDYTAHAKRIVGVAAQCGIAQDGANAHLIVDMFTYLPFRTSYRPAYVSHLEDGVMAFAKAQHSSGLITLCRSLPADVQAHATQSEGVCCIPASVLSAP